MKQAADKAEVKASMRLYRDDVKAVEKLRAKWKVQKTSEVLRRALHEAVAAAS